MNRRVQEVTPEFVDSFPRQMSAGILYISTPFRTCGHLCCCGCGEEVITPLSPAQWALTYDGETVSLKPSIGNHSLRCRSHYWIREGRVDWSPSYTADEVAKNRANDRRAWEAHVAAEPGQSSPGIVGRIRRWLAQR